MSQKNYLDLAGLTAYDRKLKEWFKAGVVDIADDAIRALFVTVAEGPADNEIWYTTTNNVGGYYWNYTDQPIQVRDQDRNLATQTYKDGIYILSFPNPIKSLSGNSDNGGENFYAVYNIKSITLPEGFTEISSLFYNGKGLEQINLPSTITKIDYEVFSIHGQTSTFTINYNGTQEQWNQIEKNKYWKDYCYPEIIVHCTDGDIIIPGWTEPEEEPGEIMV